MIRAARSSQCSSVPDSPAGSRGSPCPLPAPARSSANRVGSHTRGRASFLFVSTTLKECLTNTDDDLDPAEFEKLFLSLA